MSFALLVLLLYQIGLMFQPLFVSSTVGGVVGPLDLPPASPGHETFWRERDALRSHANCLSVGYDRRAVGRDGVMLVREAGAAEQVIQT